MNVFIILIALAFLLGLLFFFKSQRSNNNPSVKIITAAELRAKLESDLPLQIVDVRTPQEYNSGHIEKAVNIDYMRPNLIKRFSSYDKEKPLFLYCRSGNRSGKTAAILAKEGFSEIYDLRGGMMQWNKGKN